ncbi:MAG: hypothetical protein ACXAB4_10490, partial [Candidatus Hodarchaeales archaeon]
MRKPTGYWQDINNIQLELQPFIIGDGMLCGYTKINTENPMLARSISQYHGGIQAVREQLGLTLKKCSDCGETKSLQAFRSTRNGNRTMIRSGKCKQCEQARVAEYRDTPLGAAANICRYSKARAKHEKWEYDLDRKWVLARLNEIDWK